MSVTAITLVGVVLYYGIISDAPLPDRRWLQGKNDLALHALAFFALSLPVLALWPRLISVVLLTGLAGAVEVAQFWLPRRNPGLDDILASLAGVVLGAVVLWIGSKALWNVRTARGNTGDATSIIRTVGQNAPLEDDLDANPTER
ncbi:VanZ family protein [Tateyamaria pelophila]|uniref:VanZ family protein n=1 Tax=Tateyamaria pelophila TaxID=328415 RepID=UPI001CBA8147|nr:VanZ family protein [Tateyamaria pelophila]